VPGSSDDSQSDPDATASTGSARRRPGLVWLIAALLVPAVLAALLIVTRTGPTEDDLRDRSLAALEASGITGARVDFSGRDATVVVPAGADADQAREVVAAVDGVRVANATGGTSGQAGTTPSPAPSTAPSPTGSPTPAPSPSGPATVTVAPFSIVRTDTSVSVQAVVRDQAAKEAIVADARLFLDEGAALDDRISVDPATAVANPSALIGLLRALSTASGDATVRYDGTTVTLTGQVVDQATKATAARSAAAAVPGAVVANQLRVPQPPRPPVTPACQTFEAQLIRWRAGNRIGFLAGTSLITEPSVLSVVRVATLLRSCDTVRVEVAGHTDNLGDPRTSQPLSERRAEAVQAELVRRGVPAERITTRGYGESRPLAPNSTAAGRIANRRVEIKVAG
jgi:outer membrane protein OmpA-like peptidoglycan-associated protein